MPMELYSSEAFARDIVNAISQSEGRPLNIGGNHHVGIERDYAFQLVSEAKKAIEGNFGAPATQGEHNSGSARSAAIMAAIKRQDGGAEPSAAEGGKATPAKRARKTGAAAPRVAATRRRKAAAE